MSDPCMKWHSLLFSKYFVSHRKQKFDFLEQKKALTQEKNIDAMKAPPNKKESQHVMASMDGSTAGDGNLARAKCVRGK